MAKLSHVSLYMLQHEYKILAKCAEQDLNSPLTSPADRKVIQSNLEFYRKELKVIAEMLG